ncbi:Branchpoint-bridging protein, partial [Clarias magur]
AALRFAADWRFPSALEGRLRQEQRKTCMICPAVRWRLMSPGWRTDESSLINTSLNWLCSHCC